MLKELDSQWQVAAPSALVTGAPRSVNMINGDPSLGASSPKTGVLVLRRALLMPQGKPGSSYRCGQST